MVHIFFNILLRTGNLQISKTNSTNKLDFLTSMIFCGKKKCLIE